MNLLKAERLQAHEELLHYHAKRITIDDETLCPVCRRSVIVIAACVVFAINGSFAAWVAKPITTLLQTFTQRAYAYA